MIINTKYMSLTCCGGSFALRRAGRGRGTVCFPLCCPSSKEAAENVIDTTRGSLVATGRAGCSSCSSSTAKNTAEELVELSLAGDLLLCHAAD
jgi:hypothetical protein